MPRRQRWTPVRGTGNRIYDPRERVLVLGLDAPARAAFALSRRLGLARAPRPRPLEEVRDILVLRLDRIGDVLMCLPALHDLRAAAPRARIRLAVGRWSETIARGFPVDEVLVWSAPWVGRPAEGASSFSALAFKARALRSARLDLALDLQGDLRASLLLWLTGAVRRVGYANTGGDYLLTDVVPLDETVSWVEQNRRAVAQATGRVAEDLRVDPLTAEDRSFAEQLLQSEGLLSRRPLVGLHPSGGRRLKQWPVVRWVEVASRLQRECGATILVTGSTADGALATGLAEGLSAPPVDLTGRLDVRQTLAVIGRLDLFLSPDTGPMHLACAAGTPTVSVFGPSDSVRYFTGRELRRPPRAARGGPLRAVVRALQPDPPPARGVRHRGAAGVPAPRVGGSRLRRGRPPAARGAAPGGHVKAVVFWGEGSVSRAKARVAEGATVLLWGRREAAPDPALRTADWSPDKAARIEEAVTTWVEAASLRPLLEGRRFGELFSWQDVPLWPLARRFFLSPQSGAGQCVRLLESYSLVFETELPDEVEAVGLREDEVRLLERCATARGVLFQGESGSRKAPFLAPQAKTGLLQRVRALGAAFTPGRPNVEPETVVFVRPAGEAGETAAALERLQRVARDELGMKVAVLGGEDGLPPERFLDDGARKAVAEAEAEFSLAFDTLKEAPSTAAAFTYEGIGFADLAAADDLLALFRHLYPAGVRRAEGLRAFLRSGGARALCATAGDVLALAAARAEKVLAVPFAHAGDGPAVLQALQGPARGAGMVG
jgi:ADP-heptose:LPS heptosyltransferase